MLNLIQHLTKSGAYETLKQVQGDRLELFTRPSSLIKIKVLPDLEWVAGSVFNRLQYEKLF